MMMVGKRNFHLTNVLASVDREALEKKAGEIFDNVLVSLSRDTGDAGNLAVEALSVEEPGSFFRSLPRSTLGLGDFVPASVDSPAALASEIAAIWSTAGNREFEELAERLYAFAKAVPEDISGETSEISTNVYVMY